jgi:serine phosphatase RsbU (regulator of sigma subunit)
LHTRAVAAFVPPALAVMAVVILLILVLADLFDARVAADSTRIYHQLRQAMTTQDAVVRLQLDEETGIRGYVATADTRMLAPFFAARGRMTRMLASLRDELAALHEPELQAGAARMAALNALWERTIARPSLVAHPPSQAANLQIRGKPIIDAFRRNSSALEVALNERSDSLLDALFAELREVSWISLALVVLVAAAAIAWLRHQSWLRIVYESAERQIESLQRVADAFHQAQLPHALPSSPTISFDATYVPAEEVTVVGGDWYDVFTFDHRRYYFSMGDVGGHGLEAAIVASRVRQTISTLATIEHDPAVILEQANALLRARGDLIVTALCGSIDETDGAIIFASSGHPPALIVTPRGASRALTSGAPPLGVTDRLEVTSRADRLLPGEMLVCYTDGVIENERNIVAGEARLRRVLASLKPNERARPARAIRYRILGAGRGRDDVAILTIRRAGPVLAKAARASTVPLPAAMAEPLR